MSDVKEKKPKDKSEKKEKSDKKDKSDKKEKKDKHSSSSAAVADAGPAEDWEANRIAIENICKVPPNNMCNDCNQPGTRWASVNHGVFVCIRCSGIHRSLGVHISKVKSTNMDKWTASEVKLLELIGNRRAKEMYEARLPKGFKPLSGTEPENVIKNFIQKKYEERTFAMEGVADVLKKQHKLSGYGRKGGVPGAAGGSTPGGKEGAAGAVKHEDAMKSLYGASSAGPEKKKKVKPLEGLFGTVTVAAEEHDARRAALLAHFGVVVLTEAPADTAAA
jgi:hypothetical protein